MAAEIGIVNIINELTTFTWSIDVNTVLSIKKVEESIWSPIFITPYGYNETTEWRLQLYPNGINRRCRGYVSLYLRQVGDKKSYFAQRVVHFCIRNSNNEDINGTDVATDSEFDNNLLGVDKFISKDVLTKERNKVLRDGMITIICCIAETIPKPIKTHSSNKPPIVPRTRSLSDFLVELSESEIDEISINTDAEESVEIIDEFEQFLETGENDVTFITSDKTFYAHRVILNSRSSAFTEMFQQDKVQGKETSIVDASDLTGDVLKEVLRFVYVGETTNFEEKAHEILSPANRYALHELKAMCEEAMIIKLNVQNASEYLVLSFLHDAAKLRDRAMEFIVENSKDITSTPGFKAMAGSHANVIAAIFATLSVKSSSES